jgi:hypothetical protein
MKYFRRFRMEIDFEMVRLPEPRLPEGFRFSPWQASQVDRHAVVKYQSFQAEIDSQVFRCLGEIAGCQRLMYEITGQKSFLDAATWLLVHEPADRGTSVDCGTIQGLIQGRQTGAIQNIGIIPEYRGFGLGRALLIKSLAGFRGAGLRRVYLEVTAENSTAVNLYRSLGFKLTRTMYKAVEIETANAC